MAEKKTEIRIGGDTTEAKASIVELREFTKESFRRMAGDADKSGAEISAAFKKMGIRTESAIKASSDAAKANYEKIKNSGTASANDIARAHAAMTAKIKANNRELEGGAFSLSKVYGTLRKNYLAITASIVGTGYTIKKAFDFAESGAKLKVQRQAFDHYAKAVGSNGDEIIASLKKVSKGTVKEADIVASAGRALLLGLAPEKLVNLMEIARASSKLTGDTVTKSFDDITLGIGRQSKLILDNLGIILDVNDAYKEFAEAQHISVDQMTEADRKLAVLNATAKAGGVIIQNVGADYESTSDRIQRVRVRIGELTDKLKLFAAVVFEKVEPVISDLGGGLIKIGKLLINLLKLPFAVRDAGIDKILSVFGIRKQAEAVQELAKKVEEVKRVQAEARRESVKSKEAVKAEIDEEIKGIDHRIRLTEKLSKKQIENQQDVNKATQKAIDKQKELLEVLKDQVRAAEDFSQSIDRLIAESERQKSQLGLDTAGKLASDLGFGAEDLASARKAFAAGDTGTARELATSALKASLAIKTTSETLSAKVRQDAERLEKAVVEFAAQMKAAAEEAQRVGAIEINREIESLEQQLKAGEATIDGIREGIGEAKRQAQELKDKLRESTTATHTEKIVQARAEGGEIRPITARTGRHFPGYGGGDRIPILGEAGEFMMRKESVRKLGLKAAHAFNRGDIQGLLSSLQIEKVQKLAAGGSVQPTDTMNVNLLMGEKRFEMKASRGTAKSFAENIKLSNIIHGRRNTAY